MEQGIKRIALGILAHVDAGKTTLSEGLLFSAGEIRKLGRVDTRDAFLDINEIERKRGITIFSKQAILSLEHTVITLLDTPGHVDFSAEAERTLSVLDYAVLVISGTDGIQSHTKTLWNLLEKHRIPTFVFINKMDLIGADKERVFQEFKSEFGDGFVEFTEDRENLCDNLALCSEELMEEVLSDTLSEKSVAEAIRRREVFPCFSGSALKMQGVDGFLKAFDRLTLPKSAAETFGAKVFKIAQDEKGNRLTYMKITGGSLRVRSQIQTGEHTEKVNEIRIYSGEKYRTEEEVFPGCVCAVTGLKHTMAGQGLGAEQHAAPLTAEPIFSYRVILPPDITPAVALEKFRELEQEETQLMVTWHSDIKEIQLRMMGEIQLEILKQLIKTRFQMDVDFEEGGILYKETIGNIVEGVGHFEPLRHYAEVHLVLTPLPRGSGMQFETDCPESVLDKNWQRLVLAHLMEKEHLGVLTGSPITDIKITLKSGAAHQKHTEGGDFRQATYRAVRQGLMQANSLLLEPYYDFVIEVPGENVGKVMTDLNLMGAEFSVSHVGVDSSKVKGTAPAELIRNYQHQIISYTHGSGRISCNFGGYGPCRNAESVIESVGYSPENDTENTPDSVFCSHGAGFHVKWNQVPEYMHLESVLKPKKTEEKEKVVRSSAVYAGDDELLQIFERTYGKVESKLPSRAMHTPKEVTNHKVRKQIQKKSGKSYLLIDGYNMIFAWDSLKKIARDNLENARWELLERLSVYRVFKEDEIILVFDAYKVKGNRGEVDREKGITVVYTKEAQTADAYIEKAAKELSRDYNVTVATSDALEQMLIFGSGAYRMTAKNLEEEVLRTEQGVREMAKAYNLNTDNVEFQRMLEEKISH